MTAPLTKGVIATYVVIIFWQVRVSFSSGAQCQNVTYSSQNRVLTNHAFATEPFATIKSCVIFCKERPKCKSINYYQTTETCEMNTMNAELSPENMMDFKTAVYMTIAPCYYDKECRSQEEICLVQEGGRKCKACLNEALGLEDGRIPDSAFNASSIENQNTLPHLVRLNSDKAWSASRGDNEPWVQVDLGKDVVIRKIATQGKHDAYQHTKTYMLSSRADGETDWVLYKEDNVEKIFQGNDEDKDTVVFNVLSQHIRARFVRLWPKTTNNGYKTMRVELYGCFLQ